MPESAIELTYEKILEAASKLSEEDRERLFLSLNKDYAKALVVTITLGTLGILGTFPVYPGSVIKKETFKRLKIARAGFSAYPCIPM